MLKMENFAAQVCGMAPTAPDLSGLEDFEYSIEDLNLRCYMDYYEAENNGDVCRSAAARAYLIYAYAGTVDVYALIELAPGLKEKIEAAYLDSLIKKDAEEIANFNLDMSQKLAEDRAWERAKEFA
ncbi:MAG: hypothetical protein WC829_15320 [Hyphomicrobium sp.]|jgi:hypothetical protein